MEDLAISVAKKTGDYSVLSHVDICVVALTYELDLQEKSEGLQVSFIHLALKNLRLVEIRLNGIENSRR